MTDEKTTALTNIFVERKTLVSSFLERTVVIDAYLPVSVPEPGNMSLLLINDGQDLPKMPFDEMLDMLNVNMKNEPLLCIGIHCSNDRKMEYGIAQKKDYKGRGAKAGLYMRFVMEELLPFISYTYWIESFTKKSFAGFSLGGLSALDIVWNHPTEFSNVGVFSGSLWWRSKSYTDGYDDNRDRIMHRYIRKGKYYPHLKFFFECGGEDETEDRNNNGIIDSIDDTLDLIEELKALGYPDENIKYLELPDGKHDVATWARVFPEFLRWISS